MQTSGGKFVPLRRLTELKCWPERTIDVDASFIDIVEHTEIPKNLFQPDYPCRPPHSCCSMQLHMGLGTASDPARQRIERNLGDAV